MGDTKKVGTTGRFKTRYGRSIRKRVLSVEKKQKVDQPCPRYPGQKAKRVTAGIYVCTKNNVKFTGGAYTSTTRSGKIVQKMVAQREFLPNMKELLESELDESKSDNSKTEEAN